MLKRIAVNIFLCMFVTLTACSSGDGSSITGGGSTSSGLGVDISGQWRANLKEERFPNQAGFLTFLIQNGNVGLNPSTSLQNTANGTFSYNNFLTSQCPVGSIVGTITGTITSNNVIFTSEDGDDFTFTFGGNIVSNNQINGDWNMHFEFEEMVGGQSIERACNLFGSFTASKIGS